MSQPRCICTVGHAINGLKAHEEATAGSTVTLPHEALLAHVVGGAIVMWNLMMINLARDPDWLWFVWPLAGWIATVLAHATWVVWSPRRMRRRQEVLGGNQTIMTTARR